MRFVLKLRFFVSSGFTLLEPGLEVPSACQETEQKPQTGPSEVRELHRGSLLVFGF